MKNYFKVLKSIFRVNIVLFLLNSCNNSKEVNQNNQQIDSLNHKISILLKKDFQDFSTLKLLDSTIQLSQHYPKGLSDAYARKGLYFENVGKYDSAYHYYLLSTDIRKKLGDKKLIAFGFTNLAETVQSLKNWSLCQSYLDSAWTLFHQVNDTIYLMKINQQYGKFYAEQGKYIQALPYFLNGFNYSKITNQQKSISTFAQSLGNVYGSLAQYDSSNIYYNQWKELIDSSNYGELFDYNCCISANYIENLELKKAEIEIEKANLNFRKGNLDSVNLQYVLAREYELALAKGNYQEALEKLQDYNDFNAKYYNQSTADAIAEMEVKYQTAKKTALNKTLLIENSRKNWILFSLISGLLLLLLLGFLLFKNYQSKHKKAKNEIKELINNQELSNLNSMLRGQLEERQRIAKDLHDSLGSTLSTVKLIIGNLNAIKNESEMNQLKSANELIDEACKDVRKIAHNLFLKADDEIDFVEEIQKRLIALELNHQIKTNFIGNNVDLSARVDIKKELFLITQELVNNTIKYANATEINIQMNIINNELNFTFEDNGIGFNPESALNSGGIGFKSLEQRINQLKGNWSIDSTIGYGMTLLINIPLK